MSKAAPLRIAIIGGGPAGCAAAIRLAAEPGIAVTLIEKSDYSDYRAGETLPPQAAGLLTDLGVWDDFLTAQPVAVSQINSAWATPSMQAVSLLTQPNARGWHIQRTWFDVMLAQAAVSAGATLLQKTRVKTVAAVPDNGWQLELFSAENGQHTLAADWVIDASGRRRVLARQQSVQRTASDLQLALIAHCQRTYPAAVYDDNSLLIETVPAGWIYAAPVTSEQCVVALMTSKSALSQFGHTLAAWQQALTDSHFIQQRLQAYQPPEKISVYPAWSQLAMCCFGQRWVAVGDAAMTFDPLTGMGISKALFDAKQVAELMLAAFRADAAAFAVDFAAYAAAQRAAFAEYSKIRRAYYQMEKRWPESVYWQEVQQL